jgi:anti-sigma B factor antagonist
MQSPFEQPYKVVGARSRHLVGLSDRNDDESSQPAVGVQDGRGEEDDGFATVVTHVEGQVVVHVSGELDMATAPELSECLDRLAASSVPAVVVDLSRLTFCDSSGLGVLVTFAHRVEELGTRLVLRSPTPTVRRVFELTATDRLFEIDT